MKKYIISVSVNAIVDIANLNRYISQELKAPDTAAAYIKGVNATIQKLSLLAGAIGTNEYVQNMFGANARHITYKKMAIIFFTEGDVAYVLHVIAAARIH
jgi:hypothetical protein